MSPATASCAELALLLQAEIDGELDAAQAASVVQHRDNCAHCTAQYQQLLMLRTQLRAQLQRQAPSHEFSAALRARILSNADADADANRETAVATSATTQATVVQLQRKPSRWNSLFPFGAGAALAAMLALLLVAPAAPDLTDAVVTEHIRSLQAEHLLDVVSTDQHTVKPWFNGKLDFAPPIVDLAANGFPLSGGRLDYLGGRTVAALVYHHDRHPINLFVWPNNSGRGSALPTCVERAGYHLCNWSNRTMNYWAISDLNAAELSQFANYWQEH